MKTTIQDVLNYIRARRLPDSFEVTITEEDRQNAQPYVSIYNCIVVTAIKRHLRERYKIIIPVSDLSNVFGGTDVTHIYSRRYLHESVSCNLACRLDGAQEAPFYGPDVVGTVFHLVRYKNSQKKLLAIAIKVC